MDEQQQTASAELPTASSRITSNSRRLGMKQKQGEGADGAALLRFGSVSAPATQRLLTNAYAHAPRSNPRASCCEQACGLSKSATGRQGLLRNNTTWPSLLLYDSMRNPNCLYVPTKKQRRRIMTNNYPDLMILPTPITTNEPPHASAS